MNQRKQHWAGVVFVLVALGALLLMATTVSAATHAVGQASPSSSPSSNPLPALSPSSSPTAVPTSTASPTSSPNQVLGSHTTRSSTALPKTAADPELVLMLFGGPPLALGGLALRRVLKRR